MRKLTTLLVLAMGVMSMAPVAFADATNDDLKAEINALKTRLAQLEAKMAEPAMQVKETGPGGHAAMEAAPSISVPSLVSGVGLSGYVDSIYSYNFNAPDSLGNNTARVFDRHPNSYNLNAAELVFQKPVSADSRVGFRTDLFMGNDSEVITSTGLGSTTDEFDL